MSDRSVRLSADMSARLEGGDAIIESDGGEVKAKIAPNFASADIKVCPDPTRNNEPTVNVLPEVSAALSEVLQEIRTAIGDVLDAKSKKDLTYVAKGIELMLSGGSTLRVPEGQAAAAISGFTQGLRRQIRAIIERG